MRTRTIRRLGVAVLAGTVLMTTVRTSAQPYPPYPPPPPPPRSQAPPPPPRGYYPPPRAIDPTPPPLSPVMRAIYAPFYVAGLVVRYGFYYAIVAPIEVFARTVNYGAEGGVAKAPPPRRRPPPPDEES